MPTDADVERGFHEQIVAAPDDVAPRLVYADWLTERGDPRGEFVHLQCALAEMDEFDPRRPECEVREAALLKKHRAKWTRELKPHVMRFEFHRGFVEHVAVKAERFPEVADELFRLAPIRSLKLGGDRTALPELQDCEALRRVRSLSVSSMRLGAGFSPPLFACPHLVNLEELDVGHNGLGAGGTQALVECPYLGRVQRLNLDKDRMREDAMEVFAGSELLSQLVELSLEESHVGTPSMLALARSGRLAGLESLNLHRNAPDDDGLIALAESDFRPRHLDLSITNASGRAVRALAEGGTLERIEGLRLTWTDTGDEGARALAAADLPHLRTLDVSRCRMTDEGVSALFAADWMGHLQSLAAWDNDLGRRSLEALAASPAMQSLVRLDLRGTPVDEAVLNAFASIPHESTLREFYFSTNRADDGSRDALQRLRETGRFPDLQIPE